jgi:hypothetical protein
MMQTITLEGHYATEAFMEGPGRELKAQAEAARDHPRVAAGYEKLIDQLCDLGEGRISAMDAAGIDVQVLSLTSPGVEQLEAAEAVAFARETNDLLAEAVRRHPDRFAGFAALPTASPEAAAAELERMVREHNFKGALIQLRRIHFLRRWVNSIQCAGHHRGWEGMCPRSSSSSPKRSSRAIPTLGVLGAASSARPWSSCRSGTAAGEKVPSSACG